jgi:hypothetical protein
MKEPQEITKARRELAACEREHAKGCRREIKGPELARRRALIQYEKAPAARPLYLIACSARKLDQPAKARELYQGQAFALAYKAAERAGADVLILSALHGATDPDAVLNPYNVTLSEMTAADRAQWAKTTAAQLDQHKGRSITVLAGANYAAAVEGFADVSRPLAGLGIGQQLAKLKAMGEQTAQPQQFPLF